LKSEIRNNIKIPKEENHTAASARRSRRGKPWPGWAVRVSMPRLLDSTCVLARFAVASTSKGGSMSKQYDLEERTFRFAQNVRAFTKAIPKGIENPLARPVVFGLELGILNLFRVSSFELRASSFELR
jgi:hypothetical protein